jgi:hypothetical protein
MHRTCQFVRQYPVDYAVTIDAGLSCERSRSHNHAEMRLAPGPVAGMTGVQVRLIDHLEGLGQKLGLQFFLDAGFDGHAPPPQTIGLAEFTTFLRA